MEDLKTSLHATPLANVSPNAKKVAERQRTAIHKSDEGGISLLQDYLEIKSFDEDCDGALLLACRKPNRRRECRPETVRSETAAQIYSPSEQPRPDNLIGYNNSPGARLANRDVPLTSDGESLELIAAWTE